MILVWLALGVAAIFGVVVFMGAPYVPTLQTDVRRAFRELYPLQAADVVLDLGSGDGVVLREVVAHGAVGIGYELNPLLVAISRLRLRGARDVSVRAVNMWTTAFPDDTTVVYAFSVSRDLERLAATIQREANRLQRPLQVISYGFAFRDKKHDKQVGAHYLFTFAPLQSVKAQV